MGKTKYIDAERFVEYFGDWYTEEGTENGFIGTIKDLVEQMPDIDNEIINDAHNEGYDVGYWAGRRDFEPRWIPVTERLPEEQGRYLITGKRGTVYSLEYEDERWYGGIQPIAWMPLPEPYKDGLPKEGGGMSDDLISRQAAIDAIERLILPQVKGETAAEEINRVAWRCAINCAEEMIVHLPSAERRGRWEDVEHAPNGLLYATCSVCGKRQTIEATNYCGNCGSDMREAKNGCDDCFVPMFYNLEDDDSICRDCEVGE